MIHISIFGMKHIVAFFRTRATHDCDSYNAAVYGVGYFGEYVVSGLLRILSVCWFVGLLLWFELLRVWMCGLAVR